MAQTTTERNPAATEDRRGSDRSGPLAGVGQNAADAYRSARERSSALYGAARDGARRTAEGLEANPVAVVVGGLALGVLVGALLPASRRERELFGPVGRRITDTAREAARAAREAGREQLDDFTDRAMEAVRASSGAADKGREGKD